MASWPSKDAEDVFDYPLTWAKQMAKDGNDTIASYSAEVVNGSCEIDTEPGHGTDFDDTNTVVWLKGGATGEECKIVNRIVTAAGRRYRHTRYLKIKEK